MDSELNLCDDLLLWCWFEMREELALLKPSSPTPLSLRRLPPRLCLDSLCHRLIIVVNSSLPPFNALASNSFSSSALAPTIPPLLSTTTTMPMSPTPLETSFGKSHATTTYQSSRNFWCLQRRTTWIKNAQYDLLGLNRVAHVNKGYLLVMYSSTSKLDEEHVTTRMVLSERGSGERRRIH